MDICGYAEKQLRKKMLHLIAGGHDCYNWEFLHFHLCDSYGGQEPNLRRTHVSPFSQHTLSSLYIMSYRPVCQTEDQRRKDGI